MAASGERTEDMELVGQSAEVEGDLQYGEVVAYIRSARYELAKSWMLTTGALAVPIADAGLDRSTEHFLERYTLHLIDALIDVLECGRFQPGERAVIRAFAAQARAVDLSTPQIMVGLRAVIASVLRRLQAVASQRDGRLIATEMIELVQRLRAFEDHVAALLDERPPPNVNHAAAAAVIDLLLEGVTKGAAPTPVEIGRAPWGLLIIPQPYRASDRRRVLQSEIEDVLSSVAGSIVVTDLGPDTPHAVVVVPDADAELTGAETAWDRACQRIHDLALPRGTSCILVSPVRDVDALVHAYRVARGLMPAAVSLRAGSAWDVSQLRTFALLAAAPVEAREGFVADVLGPLLSLPSAVHQPLLETLALVLGPHGSQRSAAKALHCHASTVRYRMDKVKDLLGVWEWNEETRFQLWLALHLLALRPATLEGIRRRIIAAGLRAAE
jgi:hypothetical protein